MHDLKTKRYEKAMFARFQYIVPRRQVTRLLGFLASRRLGVFTRMMVRWFIWHFKVDMSEALISDYRRYPSFNTFFTRALRPGARDIDSAVNSVVSPVDGAVSQTGVVRHGVLFQAKGHHFSLRALLADSGEWVKYLSSGSFLTAYLSPKDYHRVHMPVSGYLEKMIYVPGDLFAVKPQSVDVVPGLFSRNERLVMLFNSDQGRFALIMVGAMIVGSITTRWYGQVRPKQAICQSWEYTRSPVFYPKGAEIGYFELGSSVIVIAENPEWQWAVNAGETLVMGRAVGECALN